jgi:mono/diheme cytochrome c family protein
MGRDTSKLYAGSAGRPGKDGKMSESTPNITPDPETGIGKWTDEQVIAAIREGKRPDGSKLTGRMPSPAYHVLTDDDAKAIVAYLRSVPAVVNRIDRAKTGEQDKARLLNLPPATGNVDVASDPVKHGEYIVGIMRCVGCHTPHAGPAAGKAWAGGNEFALPPQFGGGKFYSSNLTSDTATGIGMWKSEDVAAAVRELVRPDGTKIHGPMNGHKDDYAQLTDADAAALAAFIKAIPPIVNKVPVANTTVQAAPGKS